MFHTDQELDSSTGLYDYGARLYDPVIGRFVTADTIVQNFSDPQTLNRYSYCRNNPLIYTDPSGHWFGIDDAVAAIVGAVVGGVSAAINGDNILEGAAIGATAAWVGWNTGGLAYKAFAGKTAILAGSTVGGTAGGGTGGGLSALAHGGDIGQGIIQGAKFGALAGGVSGGLIALGVPNAIAAACGGYASGYAQGGSDLANEGALYSFGGAVLHNALTIAGVGADGTVPEQGSPEWKAMHSTNNTYVTTPTVSFKGMDAIWMFVALLGGGYSHTWHTQDTAYYDESGVSHGYVPSGHHYKFVQGNVPYPGQNYAENNWNNFRFFSNNCTTRLGYLHPAQYSAYHNYSGQGAYWWGW